MSSLALHVDVSRSGLATSHEAVVVRLYVLDVLPARINEERSDGSSHSSFVTSLIVLLMPGP